MGSIIEKITEFIKEMLQGWVLDNLETMFTDVNTKVGTIAGEVGQTPSSWNAGIFSMIDNLSDTVMVPIAGLAGEVVFQMGLFVFMIILRKGMTAKKQLIS